MSLAYTKVIKVVGWSYFYAARSECCVHVIVCDDRDCAFTKWNNDLLSDEGSISIIGWIHCNCDISEHCFGSGSGDYNSKLTVNTGILNLPNFTGCLDALDFKVGNGCLQFWVPVNEPITFVNQSGLVQLNKYFNNGLGHVCVHCKVA